MIQLFPKRECSCLLTLWAVGENPYTFFFFHLIYRTAFRWKVGMRVEARYAGRQRYYSGIINWFVLCLVLSTPTPFPRHKGTEFYFVFYHRLPGCGDQVNYSMYYMTMATRNSTWRCVPLALVHAPWPYLGSCAEQYSVTCSIKMVNSWALFVHCAFQSHLIRPDSLQVGTHVYVRPASTGKGNKFVQGVIHSKNDSSQTCTIILNDGTRQSGVRRVLIVTT